MSTEEAGKLNIELAKEWSTSSNEAVTITLKHPKDSERDVDFEPLFTYPIFGDEEIIFGYQGLAIDLRFEADTLKPSLDVRWKDKFETLGETKADEIESKLEPFLPSLKNDVLTDQVAFQPPGEKIHEYYVDGRTFGIWTSLLTTPATKQILRHMQIFIPFFIEGGVPIELDDPDWTIARWRIFLLYAIDDDSAQTVYTFAGYSTTYRLFFYDPNAPSHYLLTPPSSQEVDTPVSIPDTYDINIMPCRQRISQFLILPPYQGASHGSQLYNAMLSLFLKIPVIREITVEDPNEEFDKLRDVNDLVRLRADPAFYDLRINSDVKLTRSAALPTAQLIPDVVSLARTTTKLASRQLSRLIEMQLLSHIPPQHRKQARITRKDRASDANDRAYYFWRLLVKQRLTRHNADSLAQMEISERVNKLDETLIGVEREYSEVLDRATRREQRIAGEKAASAANGLVSGLGAKRKTPGGDENDDASAHTEQVINGEAERRARKRAKVVDEEDDDE